MTPYRIASTRIEPRTMRATFNSGLLCGCGVRVREPRGDGRGSLDEPVELGRVVAVVGDGDDEHAVLELDREVVAGLVEAPDDEGGLEQDPDRQVGVGVRDLELVLLLQLLGLEVD